MSTSIGGKTSNTPLHGVDGGDKIKHFPIKQGNELPREIFHAQAVKDLSDPEDAPAAFQFKDEAGSGQNSAFGGDDLIGKKGLGLGLAALFDKKNASSSKAGQTSSDSDDDAEPDEHPTIESKHEKTPLFSPVDITRQLVDKFLNTHKLQASQESDTDKSETAGGTQFDRKMLSSSATAAKTADSADASTKPNLRSSIDSPKGESTGRPASATAVKDSGRNMTATQDTVRNLNIPPNRELYVTRTPTDTPVTQPQANDLLYRTNRPANIPSDSPQVIFKDPTNGAITGVATLNPLRAANGEVVRTQFGQSLIESIKLSSQGKENTIDLRDIASASRTGIPQQGLIFDQNATRATNGLIVLQRQDGAQIAYEQIHGPNGVPQIRIAGINSQDGLTRYFYEDRNNPRFPTAIIESVRDEHGFPMQQERIRQGMSDTFIMTQYKVMPDGRKIQVSPPETERFVQTRADGQIIYQRYISPQELQQRTNRGEFDNRTSLTGQAISREDILRTIKNDKTWLVANDLASAKRQLLDVTKGVLFQGKGGDEKTEHFVDMYLTRIRRWRAKGYQTANDDQLAFSLRRIAEVYKTKRTGAAGEISDSMLHYHTERMLMGMGSPGLYNNQGQVGTCYVNSYRMAAEYIFPHLVIDKWASIFSTGEAKGRKFKKGELNRKGGLGEDGWNWVMNNLCAKFRYGSKYTLVGGFPGTDESQAVREFRLLTDGGKLPLGKKAHKKYGVKMAYTYGGSHAQCWVEDLLENTWNGSSQKRTPTPPVDKLPC